LTGPGPPSLETRTPADTPRRVYGGPEPSGTRRHGAPGFAAEWPRFSAARCWSIGDLNAGSSVTPRSADFVPSTAAAARLARAVAQDAHPVAAQDAGREAARDDRRAVGLVEVFGLDDELAAGTACASSLSRHRQHFGAFDA
jgi:hypothetical protein